MKSKERESDALEMNRHPCVMYVPLWSVAYLDSPGLGYKIPSAYIIINNLKQMKNVENPFFSNVHESIFK